MKKKGKLVTKNPTLLQFQSVLIQLPFFFIICMFILWTVTGNYEVAKFVAASVVVIMINNILKKSIKFLSKEAPWSKRPKGAMNCRGIIFPGSGNVKPLSSGMPSGHAQIAGFLMVYAICMIWKQTNDIPNSQGFMTDPMRTLATVFVVITCGLIALHRVKLPLIGMGCHTNLQVLIGFTIGGGLGVAAYAATHPELPIF